MGITVQNLDKEEAWSATTILRPGRHAVKIVKCEEGTSSGGHDQLELEFEAFAGVESGGSIRDWLVVVPSTYGKVRQLLDACEIDSQSGDWDLPLGELRKSRLAIVIREEPGRDGKMRNRVVAYDRLSESDVAGTSDVPADTDGFPSNGSGVSKEDEDIPFARPPIRDRSVRRRGLFAGDRWVA